jgi:integrase
MARIALHRRDQPPDHIYGLSGSGSPTRATEPVLTRSPFLPRARREVVSYLSALEAEALLEAPDSSTWIGRRDHALLATVLQTGMRVSEVTALRRSDVVLGTGAHVRCHGKGRKERCTPADPPHRRRARGVAGRARRRRGRRRVPYSARQGPEHILRRRLRLDDGRLDDLDEAWVPVLTSDGPGVLVWPNSD